ncbi:MAG: hypothetical protein U0U66_04290 [Cytophagaceae bacterium]
MLSNVQKIIISLFIFFTVPFFASAQISPPGLGLANSASWFAVGVRQELDTLKAWQSVTYFGIGRKSKPDNSNPFDKPAILVLNQEFYHQFHHRWQYSFALSYRRQDEYEKLSPYEHESPAIRQELRAYGRLSLITKFSRFKWVNTYRQEFRSFYNPDFTSFDEAWQLRSRFRTQLTCTLDKRKIHRFITGAEVLFSTSYHNSTSNWNALAYKESRFTFYYSYSPKTVSAIFNIGYMNNLVGAEDMYIAHYLAIDVIIENPWSLKNRSKSKIVENLE